LCVFEKYRNQVRRCLSRCRNSKPCLSGCLAIFRASVCARRCFQIQGHAEWNSAAGGGGGGTESKHPLRTPQASGRPSCIPRAPSAAHRPAIALAVLAANEPLPKSEVILNGASAWALAAGRRAVMNPVDCLNNVRSCPDILRELTGLHRLRPRRHSAQDDSRFWKVHPAPKITPACSAPQDDLRFCQATG